MKNSYKIVSLSTVITCSVVFAGIAFAKPNTEKVPATNTKSGVVLTIPAHAIEMAPNVFSLGTAEVDGKTVEGIMFVHRKENAKPDNPGGGKGGGKGNKDNGSSCYAHLAKGAKWKVVEPWVLNPSNMHGLSESFLLSNTANNFQKWEDEASVEIIGNGSITYATLVADEVSPDNLNEIYFGNISDPGVIGVTITWGIFGGPPRNRELVEMDQIYDQVDFSWNNDGSAGDMDYENISTHEIGHGLGMGHPTDDCTEETMFRFASEGETNKRDLNAGDISGIANLY